MAGKLFSVMYFDIFEGWITVGRSESLSVARTAYAKARKRWGAVILAKVIEMSTNDDAILGEDIAEMRDLEYDV